MNKILNDLGEKEKESTLMDESNMVEGDYTQPEKDEQDEGGSVRNNEDSNDDDKWGS